MKDKIIYKSNSFSINLVIFFLGFILFSLIAGYIFKSLERNSDADSKIAVYILDSIFLIFALGSLFYFLKTQIIKITKNYLIISYQFLPFSRKILLEDIKKFKQIPRPVKYSKGFDKPTTFYTIFETLIILKNGKEIRTYALSDFEFIEVRKLMEKLKRNEGTFEVDKLTTAEFIFRNLSVVLFLIICLILIIGLSNALINNS
ncbi:hypothetical protein [Chryseobacterium sp. MMS23-Vi53]|uniref:hypothetical protein n=1 Tax=Chryseobacterium sp. MMS23-Vi53 TaxID=3386644 RepID=UPI0039EC7E57